MQLLIDFDTSTQVWEVETLVNKITRKVHRDGIPKRLKTIAIHETEECLTMLQEQHNDRTDVLHDLE